MSDPKPSAKIAYINNTSADVRAFEASILGAIGNGGELPEELSDVFTLSRPSGVWVLDWAEGGS